MLVTIEQTKSNFENLFDISSGGQTLFHARAPWMKVSVPFNADNVRKLTFFDAAGETLYTTRYSIIDNTLEEAVPFKYLLTKEQRFGQFEIIGKDGREGAFYTLQNGMFERKFCIEHRGDVYFGYSMDNGRNNIVSIYAGETQIAQITKPLTVIENLDIYYLHLKEDYRSMIPLLAFFTVYYDYRKYNNSGEITKNSVEISVGYSFDKNNSKYDPNWIAQEFGPKEAEQLENALRAIREQGSAKAKKIAKIIGIFFLISILLSLIILILFFHFISV